jgi:hypothetical protein
MTTNSMSCELFTEQLMAYLEHETDDATRAAIERHSITCVECGALLADLRKLRIDAANMPEIQPSRDLWSGIAARIEAPVVPIGERLPEGGRRAGVAGAVRSVWTRRWARGASVAAGLVLAAGIGYVARGTTTVAPIADVGVAPSDTPVAATPELPAPSVETREPRAEGQVAENTTGATPTAAAPAVIPAARPLELQNAARVVATLAADYDREVLRLQKLIDERRNQLDPVTVAVIEKNLLVIDGAIAECKKAIANDPASGFLIESLNQSLRTKVELMRTAALLPSRT